MRKKLTITLDEEVYKGLYAVVGSGHISRFIEELVKPYVLYEALESAYQEMAEDREREAEALEWAEVTIGDVADEAQ